MGRWRDDLHPRDRDGRFADRLADVAARSRVATVDNLVPHQADVHAVFDDGDVDNHPWTARQRERAQALHRTYQQTRIELDSLDPSTLRAARPAPKRIPPQPTDVHGDRLFQREVTRQFHDRRMVTTNRLYGSMAEVARMVDRPVPTNSHELQRLAAVARRIGYGRPPKGSGR